MGPFPIVQFLLKEAHPHCVCENLRQGASSFNSHRVSILCVPHVPPTPARRDEDCSGYFVDYECSEYFGFFRMSSIFIEIASSASRRVQCASSGPGSCCGLRALPGAPAKPKF
jgi:hypothetical protein